MVDIVILLIALVSVLVGFFRGFVREALSLVTWIVSIWLALRFYPQAAELFRDVGFLKQELLRNIAGFATVFIVCILLLSMISFLINKVVTKTGIKGTDRVLGFIFGIARALLIVVALLLVGQSLNLSELQIWQDSKLIPHFSPITEAVNDLLPQGLRVEGIGAYIGEGNTLEVPKEVIEATTPVKQ